jgi:hypothetical protein
LVKYNIFHLIKKCAHEVVILKWQINLRIEQTLTKVYEIKKGKRLVFPFSAPKNTVKFNFTNAILMQTYTEALLHQNLLDEKHI